jgi:hypothetical protein
MGGVVMAMVMVIIIVRIVISMTVHVYLCRLISALLHIIVIVHIHLRRIMPVRNIFIRSLLQ